MRLLRDRCVEGRLSTETFADRVGLAYRAKSHAELAQLTSDVRPAALPRRAARRRAPNCDRVVPDDCVSRKHAELWREDEHWFVRDLGSRNGTRVNGVRVIEATTVRRGDRLDLGGAPYRLR